MNIFQFVVLILLSIYCGSAEYFSAITDVNKLLDTRTAVISDLPNYITKEKLRIAHLENQLQILKKQQHELAMNNVSDYMENPLNAFKLIKSLAHDLRGPGEPTDFIGVYMANLNKTSPYLAIPDREDLIGATRALVRLQRTYKLDVSELAKGILKDAYGTPLTSEDCFEIGRIIYKEGVDVTYTDAIPWFKEALWKYQQGDKGNLLQAEILEYISFSYYKLDQMESAIKWSLKVLVLEPGNEKIHNNILYYFKRMADTSDSLNLKGETGELSPQAVNNTSSRGYNVQHYEALCRGEFQPNRTITKRLFCWYSSKQHPFLKLAPIKVEQVYIEPDVFVFHQVISDDEIQQVKELATPRFNRASVVSVNGTSSTALYRVCKTGWLGDRDAPVVARLTRRIADMSGLSMDSAEQLQVANYGVGGQYDPHYDYSDNPQVAYSCGTNRIATLLFYMSEVAQGGATVFTELGLSVFPIKNAALYWLNLHPSGEGDLATRHAACPVLRGSKWVANKWIHLKGQELIRPCTLEYQPKTLVRSLPKPLPKTLGIK